METYPLKWVTEWIAVGYAPRQESHLQDIFAAGVRSIVNLCAECYDLHEAEENANFQVYYLPVHDEQAPSLSELADLLEWMNTQIEGQNKILVHCRYGIGRTGTVVMAYLLQAGYDYRGAKKLLTPTPSWPTTRVQIDLLDDFSDNLKGLRIKDKLVADTKAPQNRYFARLKEFFNWDN